MLIADLNVLFAWFNAWRFVCYSCVVIPTGLNKFIFIPFYYIKRALNSIMLWLGASLFIFARLQPFKHKACHSAKLLTSKVFKVLWAFFYLAGVINPGVRLAERKKR